MAGRVIAVDDGQYRIALGQTGAAGGRIDPELDVAVGLNRRPVQDWNGEILGQNRLAKGQGAGHGGEIHSVSRGIRRRAVAGGIVNMHHAIAAPGAGGKRKIGAQIAGDVGIIHDAHVDVGRGHPGGNGGIIRTIGAKILHPLACPSRAPSGSPGRQSHVAAAGNTNSGCDRIGAEGDIHFTKVAVGTNQRHIHVAGGFIRRVAGVRKFNVAGPGCDTANQTRHIAAVVDVITGGTATNTEETAADEYVGSKRFDGKGIYRIPLVDRRVKSGVDGIGVVIMIRNTRELVVSGVHERGVHRAVHGIQAGYTNAAGQIERGEITANQNAAIRLQGDGINRIHFAGERIQCSGSRVEHGIHGTVRVEAGQTVIFGQLHVRKGTADQNLAIGLHGHGINGIRAGNIRIIRANARVEGGINRAIHIQTGHPTTRHTRHRGERAANDDPAGGIQGDGINVGIRTGSGVEGGIQRTVLIQPCHLIDVGAVVSGKLTAHDHLVVRQQGDGRNQAIRTETGIERRIQRAVIVQTGDAEPVGAVEGRKITGDQQFPKIGGSDWVQRQGVNVIIGPAVWSSHE